MVTSSLQEIIISFVIAIKIKTTRTSNYLNKYLKCSRQYLTRITIIRYISLNPTVKAYILWDQRILFKVEFSYQSSANLRLNKSLNYMCHNSIPLKKYDKRISGQVLNNLMYTRCSSSCQQLAMAFTQIFFGSTSSLGSYTKQVDSYC